MCLKLYQLLQFLPGRRLEIEAWNDLAKIYTKLESLHDAEICLSKAKCIEFYSSRTWHQTGSNAVQEVINLVRLFTLLFFRKHKKLV